MGTNQTAVSGSAGGDGNAQAQTKTLTDNLNRRVRLRGYRRQLACIVRLFLFQIFYEAAINMDQPLLLLFSFCLGFLSGYGVRAMISLRHRREAQEIGRRHRKHTKGR